MRKGLLYILVLLLVCIAEVYARDRDIYPVSDRPVFKVGVIGPAGQHTILSAVHSDSAVSAAARGALLVRNSSSKWARLALGASGTILRSDGSDAVWAATTNITTLGTVTIGVWQATDVDVPYGGTGVSSLTDGGILLGSGSSAITALGVAANGQIPIGDGATDPVLATITAVANETDVTNGAGSITIGIVDPLIVGKGGTGVSTLTDGGILLGSGTGAITAMSVLADGSIVVGDGTTDPVALAAFTASTGDLIHEAGGLEADVSGYTDGLYGMASGVTADIDTEGELETALGGINVIVSTEIDTFSELNALVSDKTLVNEEDAATWDSLGTFSAGITIATGQAFTVGTTTWTSSDEMDGTKIKDADYGDVDVSAGGAWTVSSVQVDSVALGTDTTGDYAASITGGTGIDSTGATSGENISHTLSFDSTEIDATTWSDNANASNAWTFDVSGTDHTMTAESAKMAFSHEIEAEQVTSTDDITMQGHLLALGDNTDTTIEITFESDVVGKKFTWNKTDSFEFDDCVTLVGAGANLEVGGTATVTGDLSAADLTSTTGILNLTGAGVQINYEQVLTIQGTNATQIITFDSTAHANLLGFTLTSTTTALSTAGILALSATNGIQLNSDVGVAGDSDLLQLAVDTLRVNGAVGIRIAPTYPLHVPWISGDAVSTAYFGSSNASNNQVAVHGQSYSLYGIRGDSIAAAGVYGTSAANVGVIGIGAGGANARGGEFDYYSATDNNTLKEVVRIRRYTTHASNGANGIGGSINFRIENDNNQTELSARIGALLTDVTDGAEKSSLVWYTRDVTTSEKMRLDYSGNLGIGTAVPVSLLDADGPINLAIQTVTGNTTLDETHSTVLVNASGNVIITLPTAASAYNSTDDTGRIYTVKKIDADANTVTIDADGSEQIEFADNAVLTKQGESITFQTNGTAWLIL